MCETPGGLFHRVFCLRLHSRPDCSQLRHVLYQSAKRLTFTEPRKSYKRSPGSAPGGHAVHEKFSPKPLFSLGVKKRGEGNSFPKWVWAIAYTNRPCSQHMRLRQTVVPSTRCTRLQESSPTPLRIIRAATSCLWGEPTRFISGCFFLVLFGC